MRAVADAIPFPFSYVDRDGRVRFNNAAYGRWVGAPTDQFAGRPVQEVVGEAAYALVRERMRTVLDGNPVSFEQEIPFRGAGRRFVSVTYTPDRDESGGVRGFYSLILDLTRSRRRELELRDAIAREALAEQGQRRELARELDDEFGQMLSLVSMKLEALREAEATEQSELLQEIMQLVAATRGRLTSLSYHVSPSVLFDVGIVAAAEWLAEELERRDGVRVEVRCRGELDALDEAGRIILFRALRSVLSKLDGEDRTTARVRIEAEGRWARLEVAGVKLPSRGGEGTAVLRATRTLLEQLGGDLIVQEGQPGPQRVRIELPMRGGAPTGREPQ